MPMGIYNGTVNAATSLDILRVQRLRLLIMRSLVPKPRPACRVQPQLRASQEQESRILYGVLLSVPAPSIL